MIAKFRLVLASVVAFMLLICALGRNSVAQESLVGSGSPEKAELLTAGLTNLEIDAGWIGLFDGSTTFGWRAESNADWKVMKKTIHVTEGKAGLLRTTSQFDDFELKLDFKIAPTTNSGIFIRTGPKPKKLKFFEINLAAPSVSPFSTGALVQRKKAPDVTDGDEKWFEQWHQCTIIAQGPSVKIWIDDKQTMDYVDPLGEGCLGKGYIGLQKNKGSASFRNVRLRPLKMKSLFNGKDLTGWKTDQKLDSKFEVTDDQELRVLSGKGQIESADLFGNFIFSTQCRTNTAGLNSGVFFRCIPGDVMNGYESQIQNQFKDKDRTQPVDQGTGAIFRRSVARRVNANDQQWFTKTIIADGPHIAVWVNGYQVTDWSDQRKPDKNPRRGRRLEAGSIIFQGHDPTTDVLFRKIQAREMNDR